MSFTFRGLCQVVEPGIVRVFHGDNGSRYICRVATVDDMRVVHELDIGVSVTALKKPEFEARLKVGTIVEIKHGEIITYTNDKTGSKFTQLNTRYHISSFRITNLVPQGDEDEQQ